MILIDLPLTIWAWIISFVSSLCKAHLETYKQKDFGDPKEDTECHIPQIQKQSATESGWISEIKIISKNGHDYILDNKHYKYVVARQLVEQFTKPKTPMIDDFCLRTFPVRVSFEQVGFSGSMSPQVPSGNSLRVKDDLSSFSASLAVGSSAVK